MRFIGRLARKSNKSIMLARFSSLPHGLELLKGNVHNQNAPPNGELVMSRPHGMPIIPVSPLDPRPPWGTLIKFQASANHYIH
jgi:hypothetical protein